MTTSKEGINILTFHGEGIHKKFRQVTQLVVNGYKLRVDFKLCIFIYS